MRRVPSLLHVCCITALVSGVVFLGGCDTTGEKPEDPPTVDRVELLFVPVEGSFTWQTIVSRRWGSGEFETDGRVLLAPGDYRVDLQMFDGAERVTQDVLNGPYSPLLRYRMSDSLAERLTLREMNPSLVPLDSVGAPLDRAQGKSRGGGPTLNTSPAPLPGLFVTVADTTGATGPLRLVLQQFEHFTDYRRGVEPLCTDFDATFPLRTVPSTK